MSKISPDFRVNICYRTIKLTKIFSGHAKAKLTQSESSNLIYQFTCDCAEFYVGQTKRLLCTCAGEHQRPSSGSHVYSHISNCEHYDKKATEYSLVNKDKFTSPKKARTSYFHSRFSIIQRGFRNEYDRKRCEAYHIRMKRPKINDQKQLKAFGFF